jgi:hypothetical protein
VIKAFPAETYPAILQALSAAETEYRWSVRWIARSKEESAKDIERYQKRFYGSRKSWGTAIMETVGNYECLTKIYLADPSASTDIIAGFYRQFGLEDHEIAALSQAVMKRDYFYKSPGGSRMFKLSLDPFQLALLAPDHGLLDGLEEKYGRNCRRPLATEILEAKGFRDHNHYLS